MLFNSWEFVILLIITFILFYAVPDKPWRKCAQTYIFILASAIFYAWEDWRLLILLILSCGGNAIAAIHILSLKIQGKEETAHRWVVRAVILNLLLLGIFKYAGFIVSSIPGTLIPETWIQWV